MKKILLVVVVLALVALGVYFFFFKKSGLTITETTTKGSSVSVSSRTFTPSMGGETMQIGDLKMTVTGIEEDNIDFAALAQKNATGFCAPAAGNETFNVKKGQEVTINHCTDQTKVYTVSFK